MEKVNLLLITHSVAKSGGGEFDFEILLNYFRKKENYSINVLFPKGSNPRHILKYCDSYGYYSWGYLPAHFTYGITKYFKYLFKFYRQFKDLRLFLKKEKMQYNLCIANVSVLFWPIVYLAFKKFKVVVFIRENIHPAFLRYFIYKIYAILNVYVITNSISSLNDFQRKTNSSNSSCIYPALPQFNINLKCRINNLGKIILVNIGDINSLKNQMLIIEALAKIEINLLKLINIYFIGHFDEFDKYYIKLLRFIKNHSLENIVYFCGRLEKEQVFERLGSSDLLIISSITEGMPITILEALKFAKPVISTNVGGISEVIQNGINGYLYSNSSELASILTKILNNREILSEISNNAIKSYNEYFSLSSAMENTDKIFKSIISK